MCVVGVCEKKIALCEKEEEWGWGVRERVEGGVCIVVQGGGVARALAASPKQKKTGAVCLGLVVDSASLQRKKMSTDAQSHRERERVVVVVLGHKC